MSQDSNSFRDDNWLDKQKFKLTSLFSFLLPKKKTHGQEKQILHKYDQAVNGEKADKENLKEASDASINNARSALPDKPIAKEQSARPLSKIKVSSPRILETNLIQGEVVSFFDWRRSVIILTVFTSISILIVGGVYGYLFIWERIKKQESQMLDDDYKKIQEDIKTLKADVKPITNLEKKLIMANIVLDRHIYWTNFFKFLEKYTLSDVFYDSFSGGTEGVYTFSAHGKNFHTVVAQLKLLRSSEFVISAVVTGGTLSSGIDGEGQVDFSITITIDPKIFLKLSK